MKKGFTLIELVIVVVILSIIVGPIGFCLFGFRGLTESTGFRDGTIQKLTTKGMIWQSMEGELALPGFKVSSGEHPTMSNTFEFSVWDQAVFDKLSSIPANGLIRVYYRQHRFVAISKADTAYEVWKVDTIPQAGEKQ